jgi:hypothetical protein
MKRQTIVLTLALLTGCAMPQQPRQAQLPGMSQDYQSMMQGMETAQAGASRPGDEKLTCDELQEQLVAVVQDPDLLADVEAAGVAAEKDVAQMQAAQGEVAAKSAATLIASIVPGAAMGHMMAGAAENQSSAAAGQAHMKEMMAARQQMMAHMDGIMRGQRLVELGQVQKCEWAADI